MLGHAAHVGGDGHAVVVEDDQQLLSAAAGGGQALIGQPAGEGAVSDEGQHLIVRPRHLPGPGHAQGHRHRVGGVSGDEGVVDALPRLGEAGDPAELPQGGHLLPAAGEDLVDVALVAHVEHQPVRPGVEHPVNGHRQLHRAQIGGQVAPGPGHAGHQLPAQLGAQGDPFLVAQLLQQGVNLCFFSRRQGVIPRKSCQPVRRTGPISPMAVPSRAPMSTWGRVWPRCSFSRFFSRNSWGRSSQWSTK